MIFFFCTVPGVFFSRQSSIGACQNLDGCAAFPRKRQQECIDAASVITFACSDIARQESPDLRTTSIESYVHGDLPIWLGSVIHWLQMKHPDSRTPELT